MNVMLMVATLTSAVAGNSVPHSTVEFHAMPSIAACHAARAALDRATAAQSDALAQAFGAPSRQLAPGTTVHPPAFPPVFSRRTECIQG